MDALSITLESTGMSLIERKWISDVVIKSLEKDRTDEDFKLSWLKVEAKYEKVGKIEDHKLPRSSRNLHNYLRLNNNFQLYDI